MNIVTSQTKIVRNPRVTREISIARSLSIKEVGFTAPEVLFITSDSSTSQVRGTMCMSFALKQIMVEPL